VQAVAAAIVNDTPAYDASPPMEPIESEAPNMPQQYEPPQAPQYEAPQYAPPQQYEQPQVPQYAPQQYEQPQYAPPTQQYTPPPQQYAPPQPQYSPPPQYTPPAPSGSFLDRLSLKVLIPVAVIAALLALFSGLMLFTSIFSPGPDRDAPNLSSPSGGGSSNQSNAPSQAPTEAPTPTPNPDNSVSTAHLISGDGGVVTILDVSELEFTPNESGIWEFQTSNDEGDPYLWLFDAYGNLITEDDDGGGGSNALISIYLERGYTYMLMAGFYGGGPGSYTLTVSLQPEVESIYPPLSAGDVRVVGDTWFSFKPSKSGTWEFRTSDCGDSDPYIEIFNRFAEYVAYGDDHEGDLNAFISVYLNQGETYTVGVQFYDNGSCTLTVTLAD